MRSATFLNIAGYGALLALVIPVVAHGAITVDLQFGSKGPQVVELQNFLIQGGYLSGTATGNFYGMTKNAVVAFQKAKGLPATGYVGRLTRAKITTPQKVGSALIPASTYPTTTPQQQSSVFRLEEVPFYIWNSTWWFSSSTSAFQILTNKRPPQRNFADASQIPERTIDPRVVVLVRCKFIGTYTGNTSGSAPRPGYFTGSGVVVSPQGHIITAAHVLRDTEINKVNKEYENTSIVWKRDSCEVAPTDADLSPIDADPYDDVATKRFMPADIVFEPTDELYNPYKYEDPTTPGKMLYDIGGSDLDFAVLQVHGAGLPYAPLIEKLVYMRVGDPMIGLGYPGLDVALPQRLERIDTQFNGYSWMHHSTCNEKAVIEKCGLSYESRRYKEDYKKLYGTKTPLGIHTSFFRGGFSGGPIFYKGNVAGIMIFGTENMYSNLFDLTMGQWNWVGAGASAEIILTLKEKGITLPTVP